MGAKTTWGILDRARICWAAKLESILAVEDPFSRQLRKAFDSLLYRALTVHLVVPGANVDRAVRLLPLTNNQDEIVLAQLSVADLLVERISGIQIGGDTQTGRRYSLSYL